MGFIGEARTITPAFAPGVVSGTNLRPEYMSRTIRSGFTVEFGDVLRIDDGGRDELGLETNALELALELVELGDMI